ncbi:MAG: hypothetical protein J6C06_05505 [Lachnospiraceae bacterium]|nr:hypothetical protein [Lachnospiraceae bacterium]
MDNIQFCYIIEQYYIDHPDLIKILDVDDVTKHNTRTHLCLTIKYKNNNILIPLRKNLGPAKRKFGTVGYPVPSASKPEAGLDYRYIMIINDTNYLRFDIPRISNKQISIIKDNYTTIEKEAIDYINSYTRVANKGRINLNARFRESSLINFHNELEIKYAGQPKALPSSQKK